MSKPASNPELGDGFVNVWFEEKETDGSRAGGNHDHPKSDFYGLWSDHNSAKVTNAALTGADFLRHLHPKHSLVMTSDSYRLNVINFPRAYVEPLKDVPLLTDVFFVPLASASSPIPGALAESVHFGSFKVTWEDYDFLLYMVTIPTAFGPQANSYILHEGPEDPIRLLLLRVGLWAEELHNEIWVFNQGFWTKDAALWLDVQKADWKDIILKENFKKSLQKDVYGFFSSEKLYKDLGIPWKRGLIMHGPPGNGKTISLKAIMKTCEEYATPLYVKSFQSWMGEEASMAVVFNKARQVAPSVLILEDLDSLINDGNRSFFLNQMDGLQGNDGLLVIGTTNHFDRLDPGLSTRPSRFDRKYLFDDPDREERALYAVYWQKKLKNNQEIAFPDSLVNEIADSTDRFSFAYLKEAFVSSLVTLAGYEDNEKPSFASVIKNQIDVLRKQLDKSIAPSSEGGASCRRLPVPPHITSERMNRLRQAQKPQTSSRSKDASNTMVNIHLGNDGTEPSRRNFATLFDRIISPPIQPPRDGIAQDRPDPRRRNFTSSTSPASDYRQLLDHISYHIPSSPGPTPPGAWDPFSQMTLNPDAARRGL